MAILMSTHHYICFYGENGKLSPNYHQIPTWSVSLQYYVFNHQKPESSEHTELIKWQTPSDWSGQPGFPCSLISLHPAKFQVRLCTVYSLVFAGCTMGRQEPKISSGGPDCVECGCADPSLHCHFISCVASMLTSFSGTDKKWVFDDDWRIVFVRSP